MFFNKPKVRLVLNEDKYKKIKNVKPNILYNRYDLRYRDFDLLEITYNKEIYYIPFHITAKYVKLAVYMTPIPQIILDSVIKFIKKEYSVYIFNIVNSFNKNRHFNGALFKNFHIELPDTLAEYNKRFTSKTLYNRRRSKRILENDFKCEYEYYNKSQLTNELMQEYLNLKNHSCDLIGKKSKYINFDAQDLLSDFFSITDVYVLKINDKIAAMSLFSILDNENVLFINTTYDDTYTKYGIGTILFYICIKDLIARGYKRIHLGGGFYEYKRNAKAVLTPVWVGNIGYKKHFEFIKYKLQNHKLNKYLFLFNKKILLKSMDDSENSYKYLLNDIRVHKRIKQLSKKYGNKKIILYGAGTITSALFKNYDMSGLNIVGICDKKYTDLKNEQFNSIPCICPDDLRKINYDVLIVTMANPRLVDNNFDVQENFISLV